MRAIEFLTEYRNRMFQYIKSIVPTWPDYVVKDWLYANFARGEIEGPNWSFRNVGEDIPKIIEGQKLSVDTKWQLVPNMKFTMDMWIPEIVTKLTARAGGKANPDQVPRDAERHTTQAQLAQQQGGVRKEPVILVKRPDGYDLLEGWHRTIQHFHKYPDGYTGPAYVAVEQGQPSVAEGTYHISAFKINAYESMSDFRKWMRSPKKNERGMTRYIVDIYENICVNDNLLTESSQTFIKRRQEAKAFSDKFKQFDEREIVQIKLGNKIALLSTTVIPDDKSSRIELSGFTTPKKIVKINLDTEGKIDSIKFDDGSTFPEAAEFTTVGGVNITNTIFFLDKASASKAHTAIWMYISNLEGKGWNVEHYMSEGVAEGYSVSDFKIRCFESWGDYIRFLTSPKTSARDTVKSWPSGVASFLAPSKSILLSESKLTRNDRIAATKFSSDFKSLDKRDQVKIKVDNSISVLYAKIDLDRKEVELGGFVKPKTITNINMSPEGTIDVIQFEDGSQFPERNELLTNVAGQDIMNTIFFPDSASSARAYTQIWMMMSALEGQNWSINKQSLNEQGVAEST